jgi:hypothetical protein
VCVCWFWLVLVLVLCRRWYQMDAEPLCLFVREPS